MPAKLSFGQPSIRHETIRLNSGGEFKLQLQLPPFAAQIADWERQPGYTQQQLRACIVGWSDITDAAGNALPFAWEAFEAACVSNPEILNQAVPLVTGLYVGVRPEDHSKNSGSPPDAGSGGETPATAGASSADTPGSAD